MTPYYVTFLVFAPIYSCIPSDRNIVYIHDPKQFACNDYWELSEMKRLDDYIWKLHGSHLSVFSIHDGKMEIWLMFSSF